MKSLTTVRCIFVIVFWVNFALLFIGPALAAEFRLVPSLALRQEYDDNIFFTVDENVRDNISTISPGLEIVHKTENTDLSLLARVDRRLYWAHPDLNATDQTYKGGLGFSLSPKFRLSGRAAYIQDSRPDRDIETTGLVLLPLERQRQAYGGSAEYAFTEKTAAILGYDYYKDHYRSAESLDMDSNTASLGFTHDLSSLIEATKAMINFGAGRYNYTGLQVDNFSGTVGLSKQLAELWSVSLDVGGRYTVSEIDVAFLQPIAPFTLALTNKTEKVYDSSWIGHAAVSYGGEKTNAALGLGYDLVPASGYAGASQRASASFNISRRFTYEWRGAFSTSYFWNKATRGTISAQNLNQQSMSISPTLRYEPWRDVALEASYTFNIVLYRETRDEAHRSLVWLKLVLQHAFFE